MQLAHVRSRRSTIVLGFAALCGLVVAGVAGPVHAAGKSTQTEAIWKGLDAEKQTITVKVKKPGRGKDAKRLRRGREATFKVKLEGSVLERTTCAVNGRKAELADIPEGKTVYVYWRPDEDDPTQMFARKVDVIFSQEEFEERYKPTDE